MISFSLNGEKTTFESSRKLSLLQYLREIKPIFSSKDGLPKISDTPKIVVKGLEVKDPYGPYGVKGIGEAGLVPTAGAIPNALYQYDGKRRYSLPLKKGEHK